MINKIGTKKKQLLKIQKEKIPGYIMKKVGLENVILTGCIEKIKKRKKLQATLWELIGKERW